jgi:transcriptional regulator with XRE-family HTH domain
VAKQLSLRRRRVVGALRRMRAEAGLTMAQVVDLTGFSQSKLSRIENLEIGVTGDDTRTLCEAYGVDRGTTDALAELARRGRRRGWWQDYPAEVLGRFVDFVELESDACAVKEFAVDLVPGLMQTKPYAEAVIRHAAQGRDEFVAARLEVRMERQERWRRGRFAVWAIVDEFALRRPVGGARVLAEQLGHLARVAGHPRVTLQILPAGTGGHAALGSPHTIISVVDRATFVYLDTLAGGVCLADEDDVRAYRSAWQRLAAAALDPDGSVALVERIARELSTAGDKAGDNRTHVQPKGPLT